MTIKQRGTPLDTILLKVVYPFLYHSGLRKQLPRWQLWHREVPNAPAPSPAISLESRRRRQKATRQLPATTLSHKRAA